MTATIYVQCHNKQGVLGNFLKDGDEEISPCFGDLADLYAWMRQNGWSVGWDHRAHKKVDKSN
jgi:hypothetical protein